MADDVVRDIPEEMVEKATQALRDAGFVDPDDDTVPKFFPLDSGMAEQGARIDVWTLAREAVITVLSAALAGRTVVELPEPSGVDEGGTWWNHDHGAVIADDLCAADTAKYMRRRAAALLAAASHIERRLAAGSGVGDQDGQ